MRIMVKFAIPLESGNAAIRTGKLEKVFQQIVEDLKPEAAYFFPEGGERAGFFVINMDDSSQIAQTAERFFFGLNARIEFVAVMAADDLHRALAHGPEIVQRYG